MAGWCGETSMSNRHQKGYQEQKDKNIIRQQEWWWRYEDAAMLFYDFQVHLYFIKYEEKGKRRKKHH